MPMLSHPYAPDAPRPHVFIRRWISLVLLTSWAATSAFAQNPMAWRGVPPPSGRHSAAMAFDSRRGVTVLFGGGSDNGAPVTSQTTVHGDTWEWDGHTWKHVSSNGPSARMDAAMAYDSARGVMVLFGGTDSSAYRSDTWEWDGKAWKPAATAGPPARANASIAYDSARHRTVLFGGRNASAIFGDTWEWDGSAWTQVADTTVAGPGGLFDAAMAYDSMRGRAVLFGGAADTGATRSALTWEWDGSAWAQVAVSGPSARAEAAMAFDSARGVAVLFGGTGYLRDTWQWNGTAWKQVASTGPSFRKAAAMAFDSARGVTVLFGGSPYAGSPSLGDTWEWDGSAWSGGVIPLRPSGRYGAAVTYDTARGKIVLFGGYGPGFGGSYFGGDTWEWDGSAWAKVATTGPSIRYGAAIAYDSARKRTVLFGGTGLPDSSLGDTWEWDGTAWTQIVTSGPPARYLAAMAYDSARGKVVLYGGTGNDATKMEVYDYADTWEWDGSAWKQVASTGPPARYGAAIAYDSARGVAVLFGGVPLLGGAYRDTWEWDGAAWKQVATTGPASRSGAAMAYDSARKRCVLFGGIDNFGVLYFRDTWEWDGSAWRQASIAGPPGRYHHGMVYDGARDRTILIGGGRPNKYYDDMWLWMPSDTLGDPALALRWAGGLEDSAGASLDILDVEGTASAGRVDITDAVRHLRKAAGLDQNP